MWPGILAASAVVWFAVAGIGLGFLLEPELRPLVRKSLRQFNAADGLKHIDPSDADVDLWTRRSSRVAGFVAFFLGAVFISLVPIEPKARRFFLVAFAGVIPLLGYGVWLGGRHGR